MHNDHGLMPPGHAPGGRVVVNPAEKGRLGLGETAMSPSPRAGSVASFRLSEGGANERFRSTALDTCPATGTKLMSEADAGGGTGEFLPELAGLLLSEETVSGLLDVILNLAVSGIEGVAGASVSLVIRDGQEMETSNASSEVIREVDQAQYRGVGGPCVAAIQTGQEVSVAIPAPLWTAFSAQAARVGMQSVWSLPLAVRDRSIGALNLYSTAPPSWQLAVAGAARGLARQAAVVLANAAALMSAQMTNQHLQQALENRDLIGQAKGILMARESIGADEAFDILRRASQRSHRKLRDVAAQLIAGTDPNQELT